VREERLTSGERLIYNEPQSGDGKIVESPEMYINAKRAELVNVEQFSRIPPSLKKKDVEN
jgi:hypothetical protein